MRHHALSMDEVRRLPAAIDVPTAAAALGMSAAAARNQVAAGTFPLTVHRLGRLHRVSTAELHALLGIESEPVPA